MEEIDQKTCWTLDAAQSQDAVMHTWLKELMSSARSSVSQAKADPHSFSKSSGIAPIAFTEDPTNLFCCERLPFLLLAQTHALPPLLILGLYARPCAAGQPAQGPPAIIDWVNLRR